jgi:hypothetical protein
MRRSRDEYLLLTACPSAKDSGSDVQRWFSNAAAIAAPEDIPAEDKPPFKQIVERNKSRIRML